jgi:hypothetical protein
VTDSILPDDLANGLVDGTADISSLPTEFRGVAEVLAAAHQPATGAELAGMASVVQQFTAAVTTSPAAAKAGATTSGVISMFGTRVTKRAAVIVGVTLLFAGTAAAAALDVLPSTFSSPERDSTPELSLESSSSEDAAKSDSTDQSTSSSAAEVEVESESEGLDDSTSTSFPAADFGHCTAWNSGTTKNTDTPAFGALATEASEAGKSIDDYCVEVLAAHDAGDDHGIDAKGDDAKGDDSTGTSVDDHGDDSVTSNSVDDHGGKNGGGHGADDTATSVSTEATVTAVTVSAPDASPAPSVSVDDGGQSGKGGKNKGGDTSTSNP